MKRKKFFWPAVLMLGWCVVFVIAATWPLWSWAEEMAVLKGESAITFGPISEKARRLVEVELVSSSKYPARYKRLELAVFRNDWRPLMFANGGQSSPGKCTVTVLSDSYAISCLMLYRDRNPDTLQIKVPDPDRVVGMVTHFSRKLAE